MNTTFKSYSITVKGQKYVIDHPLIMGILNVTPDSFYAGSRMSTDKDKIAERVLEMKSEGADMIDIGAYSTRPDAEEVSAEEEYRRLSAGLSVIGELWPEVIVSVDTFRADVARKCVENYGVDIINDVSGGTLDDNMFATVAELKVPYILMHMRGTPSTMQSLCDYADVTADVVEDLRQKVASLRDMGVEDIILDPGFGFSKTVDQNFELMNHLEQFHELNLPLLVGISRKSMIYRTLGITAMESLNGTTVLNTIALLKGSHILRVHDVKQAVEARSLVIKTIAD